MGMPGLSKVCHDTFLLLLQTVDYPLSEIDDANDRRGDLFRSRIDQESSKSDAPDGSSQTDDKAISKPKTINSSVSSIEDWQPSDDGLEEFIALDYFYVPYYLVVQIHIWFITCHCTAFILY